jgi:hypothetical protein
MKTWISIFIWIFLLGTSLSQAQQPRDVRVVNGKAVDLGPVHQWLSERVGERPLPHWKQIEMVELKGKVGAWDRCQVKNEAGVMVELFIANLPAEVRTALTATKPPTNSVALLKERIAADEQLVKNLRRRYVDSINQGNSSTVSTRGTVVDTYQSRLDDWRAASDRLEAERRQLDELMSASPALPPVRATALAMFSGRKYADLEIWDCGIKQSR